MGRRERTDREAVEVSWHVAGGDVGGALEGSSEESTAERAAKRLECEVEMGRERANL